MELFAKYLTVEGEIKINDFYIDRNGLIKRHIDYDKTYEKNDLMKRLYHKAVNKWGKKIKLFLCSNNIQIGDLVFIPDQEEAGNVIDFNDLCYWQSKKSYKMIGEISPNATWIKEGDKISIFDLNPLATAAVEHNQPYTDIIKIKGQDGQYY